MGLASLLQALCAQAFPENLFQRVGNILSSQHGSCQSCGSVAQRKLWKGRRAWHDIASTVLKKGKHLCPKTIFEDVNCLLLRNFFICP